METLTVRLVKSLKALIVPRVDGMLKYPSGLKAPDVAFLHLVRAKLLAGQTVDRDLRSEFFRLYRGWEI